MKMNRFRVVLALVLVLLFMTGGTVWAGEAWTTDAKTGVKIGIVFTYEGFRLVSASWTGPAVAGKAEGKGMLTYVYKGKDGKEIKAQADAEMNAGLLDGTVAITWSDGDSFGGYYKAGLREGKGIFKYSNGDVYEGDWINSNMEGKGKCKWSTGDVYEGDWKNDKMEGKGIFKHSDGDVYEGDWKNGKMEGKGKYKWSTGDVYEGDWKNGKREGKGINKSANGEVYEGNWKNDKPEGSSVNAEYIPRPMASVEAAIATIKELKGVMSIGGNYQNRELTVDQMGLSILFVKEGVKKATTDFWVGWDHVKIPTSTPYREEKVWSIAFNQVKKLSKTDEENGWADVNIKPYSGQFFYVQSAHARKFMDAVATLALAQNVVLDPYYGLLLYDKSVGSSDEFYIAKSYKAAKVSAGAVVRFDKSASGIELKEYDVIVQATDGEKVFPISSAGMWEAVCREAVAGKPEATLVAKVVRNGVSMDKEVKVTNVGFGVKVPQSTPAVSQTQGPPPQSFGVLLRTIEAEEAKTLGLDNANGAMVISVVKDSAAERLQLKPNDVLLAINGIDITSTAKLQELMTRGPIMSVKIFRSGAISTLQAPMAF